MTKKMAVHEVLEKLRTDPLFPIMSFIIKRLTGKKRNMQNFRTNFIHRLLKRLHQKELISYIVTKGKHSNWHHPEIRLLRSHRQLLENPLLSSACYAKYPRR